MVTVPEVATGSLLISLQKWGGAGEQAIEGGALGAPAAGGGALLEKLGPQPSVPSKEEVRG